MTFIKFKSKINMINFTYTAKLGLEMHKTDIDIQKIRSFF